MHLSAFIPSRAFQSRPRNNMSFWAISSHSTTIYRIKSKAAISLTFNLHCKAKAALFFIPYCCLIWDIDQFLLGLTVQYSGSCHSVWSNLPFWLPFPWNIRKHKAINSQYENKSHLILLVTNNCDMIKGISRMSQILLLRYWKERHQLCLFYIVFSTDKLLKLLDFDIQF